MNSKRRISGKSKVTLPDNVETQSAATVAASVDCRSAEQLFRYANEGALPPSVMEGLQRHLGACPACAVIYQERQKLFSLLDHTFEGKVISKSFTSQTGERLNQRRKTMQDHPTTSPEALTAVHFNGETGEVESAELDGLPDEDYDDERGFFGALADQFGSAPWWVTSGVFHGLLILLVYFIGEIILTVKGDDKIITTTLDERQEIEPEKKQVQRDLIDKVVPETDNLQVIDDPVVTHEQVQEADHHETDDNMSDNTARGDEDCISDVPLGGKGTVAAIGMGGGRGGAFGQRGGGGKQHLLRKGGGGADTESAVDAALAWLARRQKADGSWSVRDTEGAGDWDPGVVGLATLAFLGAGHTEKVGKYRDNVRRAVAWMISQQREDGAIGTDKKWTEHHGGFGYHHSICGIALAEAAGMARVPETKAAAQKAVDYSCEIYQYGEGSDKLGWRYVPKAAVADLSVSGWFIMQLKSAKVSGLQVNPASFEGAARFLDSRQANAVAVKNNSDGYDTGGHRYGYTSKSPMMNTTAIGILCRLFLGTPVDEVRGAANWLLTAQPPAWDGKLGPANGGPWPMYYTYYGTLTMFQVGGDIWREWNDKMKKMLLPNQRKGGPKDGSQQDVDGSWDPFPGWEAKAGRAYSTALGALSLEVYYRYLPITR